MGGLFANYKSWFSRKGNEVVACDPLRLLTGRRGCFQHPCACLDRGCFAEVTEWSLANLCNFTPKGLLQLLLPGLGGSRSDVLGIKKKPRHFCRGSLAKGEAIFCESKWWSVQSVQTICLSFFFYERLFCLSYLLYVFVSLLFSFLKNSVSHFFP